MFLVFVALAGCRSEGGEVASGTGARARRGAAFVTHSKPRHSRARSPWPRRNSRPAKLSLGAQLRLGHGNFPTRVLQNTPATLTP